MRTILTLFMLLFALNFSFGQDEYREKLVEYFELAGAKEQFALVVTQMIDMEKKNYTGIIDNAFWDGFEAKVLEKGFSDLYDLLLPIYKKHFTIEDLDGFITFYKSDIGRRLIEKTPALMQESMQAGAQWGTELAQIVLEEMENVEEENFEKEVEGCEKFKTGKFQYFDDVTYTQVDVVRTETEQIEIVNGVEIKYQINWLSNCKYELTGILSVQPPGADTATAYDTKMTSNIYQISGDECYIITKEDEYGEFFKSKLTKIE